VNTVIPSGILAEPGKDVFAKDDRGSKSAARIDSDPKDAVPSVGDVERTVSVVNVEGVLAVESTLSGAGGDGEPLEAGETSMPVSAVADETVVPAERRPEGPLDHEEALAEQVAHELYPEARDVPEEPERDE